MSNILVTAIGSFSADIVINNLKNDGHRIVGCDIYNKEWVANSLFVNQFYQSPLTIEQNEYIEFMVDVCKKENVEYIIPLTDVEVDVINRFRVQFEKMNVIVCLSDKSTIDMCRNKYTLYECLKSQNVDCLIPTKKLTDELNTNIKFPIVVKPLDGRSSQGLEYFDEINSFQFFIKNNRLENYIVQPKINGRIVTVDVLRNENQNVFIATPRIELLRTLNGAGTSVEIFDDEKIRGMSKEIADILGIHGCVNFEYIMVNNEYKFLECNPRFSGGVAFSCMAGYDYVLNHFKCFNNEKVDNNNVIQNMNIARKYKEYVTKKK